MEDVSFCCLVDTGAQVSLISETVWNAIKSKHKDLHLRDIGKSVLGIGNKRVDILGVVDLKLNMLGIF